MRIGLHHTVIVLLAGLTAASLHAGCARKPQIQSAVGEKQPEIVYDRIVSMSPNLTEIVFALDAEDKLVGVDDYSVYPPAARDLPRMGNYIDPDLEALVAANPDLVLVVNTDEGIEGQLDRLGIRYVSVGNDTVDDILGSIILLGRILAREENAREIIDRFESAKAEIKASLDGVQPAKVALIVGRNPGALQDIYVVGSKSFLGELVEMAGGENVFGALDLPYPQVGTEAIVGADPDLIIDSTLSKGATTEELMRLRADWNALPGLKAVQSGRIISPGEGWFQIPGAYLDSTLRLFAHWLHPEIFPENVSDPNDG
jgi:iron complex transport system substrate-binding protein